MNSCDEAMDSIIKGKFEAYITCGNRKEVQESLRVQTFNARKKLPGVLQDMIGISKFEEDGILYVKVYRRERTELLERDPVTGKLVPMKSSEYEVDPEIARTIMLMKQDGLTQEEIDARIAEWNQTPTEI
jgi:hypothetical protein